MPDDLRPKVHNVDVSPQPTCIVFERHGNWAAALRRLGAVRSCQLREARGLAEVEAFLRSQPCSLVALELQMEEPQRSIERIDHLRQTFPQSTCIALGHRVSNTLALLAWEAGATTVINSPRQVALAAEIATKWSVSVAVLAEQVSTAGDIVARVRRRLPFRPTDPNRRFKITTQSKPPANSDDEPIEFEPLS